MSLADDIKKSVSERLQALEAKILGGGAKDWPDYKRLVALRAGIMEGRDSAIEAVNLDEDKTETA